MAGSTPEERVAVPVVQQSWRDVTFLHWRVDESSIAALLPDGLAVDLVDGSAWVGLTPFRVERFRVGMAPPVPFASSFPETNLRTYVRDGHGRDGLFFLSLDVSSTLNALGGRLVSVPYFLSRMSVSQARYVRYSSRRVTGRAASHDIEIRPGGPLVDVDASVHLLTGRWRAFTRIAGRLRYIAVEHQPWPLHTAEVLRLDESITTAAGLPPLGDDVLVHYSPGVDARLSAPRATRGHRRRVDRR